MFCDNVEVDQDLNLCFKITHYITVWTAIPWLISVCFISYSLDDEMIYMGVPWLTFISIQQKGVNKTKIITEKINRLTLQEQLFLYTPYLSAFL